eukprot:TRINITY_DN88359_c0_g1_i1.p1 TRINITY_DN88359_c0_g1~~TRINITY_DN88359_c0_g1_i1.p1  ORF type:complete len:1118 (-),score=144.14 TRINITY_DN88359_c0_g1_i1:3250-6603(-)
MFRSYHSKVIAQFVSNQADPNIDPPERIVITEPFEEDKPEPESFTVCSKFHIMNREVEEEKSETQLCNQLMMELEDLRQKVLSQHEEIVSLKSKTPRNIKNKQKLHLAVKAIPECVAPKNTPRESESSVKVNYALTKKDKAFRKLQQTFKKLESLSPPMYDSSLTTIQENREILFEAGDMRMVLEIGGESSIGNLSSPSPENKISPKRCLGIFADRLIKTPQKQRNRSCCYSAKTGSHIKTSSYKACAFISRAFSAPNLSQKLEEENKLNSREKLWDYIFRLESEILDQKQKYANAKQEHKAEVEIISKVNEEALHNARDLECEIGNLAHELLTKDAKIQELLKIISSRKGEAEEGYFLKKEKELNAKQIELEKGKAVVAEKEKLLEALKMQLKIKKGNLEHEEQLVTAHLEQIKEKTAELTKEQVCLQGVKLEYEENMLKFKHEVDTLTKKVLSGYEDTEYSIKWLNEASSKLRGTLNDLAEANARKEEEISKNEVKIKELQNMCADYEKLSSKCKAVASENKALKCNLTACESACAVLKEENEKLKTANQKLTASLHRVFSRHLPVEHTRSNSNSPIPPQTTKPIMPQPKARRHVSIYSGALLNESTVFPDFDPVVEPEWAPTLGDLSQIGTTVDPTILSNPAKARERRKAFSMEFNKTNDETFSYVRTEPLSHDILAHKIKSHLQFVLEKYKHEDLAASKQELAQKLATIITNTEVEGKKLDQILTGLNPVASQAQLAEIKEEYKKQQEKIKELINQDRTKEKEYAEKLKELAKRETELDSLDKAVKEKSAYLKSLERHLSNQQQNLFNRERIVAASETRLSRANEEFKSEAQKLKAQANTLDERRAQLDKLQNVIKEQWASLQNEEEKLRQMRVDALKAFKETYVENKKRLIEELYKSLLSKHETISRHVGSIISISEEMALERKKIEAESRKFARLWSEVNKAKQNIKLLADKLIDDLELAKVNKSKELIKTDINKLISAIHELLELCGERSSLYGSRSRSFISNRPTCTMPLLREETKLLSKLPAASEFKEAPKPLTKNSVEDQIRRNKELLNASTQLAREIQQLKRPNNLQFIHQNCSSKIINLPQQLTQTQQQINVICLQGNNSLMLCP